MVRFGDHGVATARDQGDTEVSMEVVRSQATMVEVLEFENFYRGQFVDGLPHGKGTCRPISRFDFRGT